MWLSGKRIFLQCRRLGFDPYVKKIPWRRKWQPSPVFLPGNPIDRGVWWAAAQFGGVAKESDTTKSLNSNKNNLYSSFPICHDESSLIHTTNAYSLFLLLSNFVLCKGANLQPGKLCTYQSMARLRSEALKSGQRVSPHPSEVSMTLINIKLIINHVYTILYRCIYIYIHTHICVYFNIFKKFCSFYKQLSCNNLFIL